MNIFFLDFSPSQCAQAHCDKHVIKMILETAQLLSTVKHKLEPADHPHKEVWYKPTHARHPCTLWVGETAQNYAWTVELLHSLLEEYTYRYGKQHKTSERLHALSKVPEVLMRRSLGMTTLPKVMPEVYHDTGNIVEAYRAYYKAEKRSFAKWTRRETPYWFKE